MKRILTTALLAGAAAFIPTQSQAGDRPDRGDNATRGAISVTVEDGRVSALSVRYSEAEAARGRETDRRDDRYDDRRQETAHDRGRDDDRRDEHDRYDHRDARGQDDVIRYGGRAYILERGQFLIGTRRGWVPVAAPVGIVVRELPYRAEHQVVRGEHYYVFRDTYYQRVRGGYQVVAEPSRRGHGHGYGNRYSQNDSRDNGTWGSYFSYIYGGR